MISSQPFEEAEEESNSSLLASSVKGRNSLSNLESIVNIKQSGYEQLTQFENRKAELEANIYLRNDLSKQPSYEKGLTLMVVGSKKAGKSSLSNTLIECDLFPSQDAACTFHMNILKYGEKYSLTKVDSDLVTTAASPIITETIEDLSQLLFDSLPKMKDRDKATPFVFMLTAPIPILKDLNLTIIDTPGLNEMKHLDQTVCKILPTVDLLIYVLHSQRAIKNDDHRFLDMLRTGEDGTMDPDRFLLDSDKLLLLVTQIDTIPHVAISKKNPHKATPTKQFKKCQDIYKQNLSIYSKHLYFVTSKIQQEKRAHGRTCKYWKIFTDGVERLIVSNMTKDLIQVLKQMSESLEDMLQIFELVSRDKNFLVEEIVETLSLVLNDNRIEFLASRLSEEIQKEQNSIVDKVYSALTSCEIDITNRNMSDSVKEVIKDQVVQEVKKSIMLLIRNVMKDLLDKDNIVDHNFDITSILSKVFHCKLDLSLFKLIGDPVITLLSSVLENISREEVSRENHLLQTQDIKGLTNYILENFDKKGTAAKLLQYLGEKFFIMNEERNKRKEDIFRKLTAKDFTLNEAYSFKETVVKLWIDIQNAIQQTQMILNSDVKRDSDVFEITFKDSLDSFHFCSALIDDNSFGIIEMKVDQAHLLVRFNKEQLVSFQTVKKAAVNKSVHDRKCICKQLAKLFSKLDNHHLCIRDSVKLDDFYLNSDNKLKVFIIDIVDLANAPFSHEAITKNNKSVLDKLFRSLMNDSERVIMEQEFSFQYIWSHK
ncbi:hypothetical protein C9374_013210 [Naegleria lovaniensis]|uniref:Dynamin N-terminal domain-containing protein n=1 Tax=Naegleria lovaniensis TaxID=51637 RepID=A0AA88GC17_NAELO|nr:uncharacterized protein C9374_013210 [Naegleria lovaniensis]KAG2372758.1 hypothetical protein C9374_013210 [Naegleria lovaniensis]